MLAADPVCQDPADFLIYKMPGSLKNTMSGFITSDNYNSQSYSFLFPLGTRSKDRGDWEWQRHNKLKMTTESGSWLAGQGGG